MKKLVIKILDGEHIGESFALTDSAYVGKDPDSVLQGEPQQIIRISDHFISRLHAQIVRNTEGEWFIKDLDSSNGTNLIWPLDRGLQPMGSAGIISLAGPEGINCEYWIEEAPQDESFDDAGEWENVRDLFDQLDGGTNPKFQPSAQLRPAPEQDLLSTAPIPRLSANTMGHSLTPGPELQQVNQALRETKARLKDVSQERDVLKNKIANTKAENAQLEESLRRCQATQPLKRQQELDNKRLRSLENTVSNAKSAIMKMNSKLKESTQLNQELQLRAKALEARLKSGHFSPSGDSRAQSSSNQTRILQAQGSLEAFGEALNTLEEQLLRLDGTKDAQRTLDSASMRIGDLMALLKQLR